LVVGIGPIRDLLGLGFSEKFSSRKGKGRRAIFGIEAIHGSATGVEGGT
jgi:hypothetical protein